MPHTLSNSIAESSADNCTTAIRKLVTLLTDKYGLPANQVRTLDELALIRTVATLDFLANNLPPDAAMPITGVPESHGA